MSHDVRLDRKMQVRLLRNADAAYSATEAAQYRESDELARDSDAHAGKCLIIRDLTLQFPHEIDMLDLGCGTGRYFHCARNVRSIVGVDPSQHMLEQARRPVSGGNRNVRLIRSALQEVSFRPHSFDLIVCVGVLAFWVPLDRAVLQRVSEMLRPGGFFFSTLVEYSPAKATLKRRLAQALRPFLVGAPRRYFDVRLQDFRITEPQTRALGREYFEHVDITKWQSPTGRIDLHCTMSGPNRQARMRGA